VSYNILQTYIFLITSDSDFADWEVLKGLKLLHILFTNLSKKDSNVDAFSYFIEDYDVSILCSAFSLPSSLTYTAIHVKY
jgi:hypothetical protein